MSMMELQVARECYTGTVGDLFRIAARGTAGEAASNPTHPVTGLVYAAEARSDWEFVAEIEADPVGRAYHGGTVFMVRIPPSVSHLYPATTADVDSVYDQYFLRFLAEHYGGYNG